MRNNTKGMRAPNGLIVQSAKTRGIKVEPMGCLGLCKLFYREHVEYIKKTYFLSLTLDIGRLFCENKDLTHRCLEKIGLSSPIGRSFMVSNIDEAWNYAKSILPVVVKPNDSLGGSKIFLEIDEKNNFYSIWKKVEKTNKKILVEKMFSGEEYRFLASREKVLAVARRTPAHVVGDGKHTIRKLIELHNENISKSNYAKYIKANNLKESTKIVVDDVILDYLKKRNKTIQYVPKKEEIVLLRGNSNISTGGKITDYTEQAHDSLKKVAVNAIRSIPGIQYGGVDIMTNKIEEPNSKEDYIILEINHNPGIAIHHFPHEGRPRDVAGEIIDLVFPETKKEKNENR